MSLARVWRAAWNRARYLGHRLGSGSKACRSYQEYRATEFDREFGVETAATMGLDELGVDLPSKAQANHYGAIDPQVVRALVRAAAIDPRQHAFVDLGSGKGRALIVAAELGFPEVVGVEFSPVLHAAALQNLAIYRRRPGASSAVSARCQDASEYAFPTVPLVVFFYNSFRGSVLEAVLANLAASVAVHPRPVYLLWPGVHWFVDIRAIIEASPHLSLLVDRDDARVYRVGSGAASGRRPGS